MVSEKEIEHIGALDLDDDEYEHATLVDDVTMGRLELAGEGGLLTLYMVKEAGPNLVMGTPDFFVVRSLTRVANLIRYSAKGLELGYYGGAASSLRSAYEALLYAHLFTSHPNEVLSWLRIGLDSKLRQSDAVREEKRLLGLAKDAFNRETDERSLGKEIWDQASKLIHHDLEGIAAECGLSAEDLVPDELTKSLEAAQGDFELAISLSELQSRFGQPGAHRPPHQSSTHKPQSDAVREEKRLLGLAKDAFNRETDERSLGKEIWDQASKLIHHDLEGIAAECGLSAEDLVPDELTKSLEAAQGDFELAISLSELQSRFGQPGAHRPPHQSSTPLPWTGEFGSLFDEEIVGFWSNVALYLAHRTADFVYKRYKPTDPVLVSAYGNWHDAVKAE